jgi:adenylate cyclase
MIVFAGLRLSTPVVLFAGGAAVIAHGLGALLAPPGPLTMISIWVGFVLLSGATAGMAYVVSGMTSLHRESVASERLGRFFAPEVARQIRDAREVVLGGVERDVTVLFSDIAGFTRMSSRMSPAEIVALLNEYFPRMVDIVFRHQGTLEKYVGDALLAVWGAPVAQNDAAARAVAAAVEMQQVVAGMRLAVPISIHVGIHSGRVAAGHIGEKRYLQYAVIGDTTNVASRICGVAEPGTILVSEETRERLGPSVLLDPVAPVAVKGKDEPLRLYRVPWPYAGTPQ